MAIKIKWPVPVYEPDLDGNVFDWVLSTSEHMRRLRHIEKAREIEEITEKLKSLDRPKVEN